MSIEVPAGYVHRADLIGRGWTALLVDRHLGDLAVKVAAPEGVSNKAYPVPAVEAAERDLPEVRLALRAAARARGEARGDVAPRPPATPALLAEDIPLEKAWRQGRRVYVRCAYASRLDTQLRAIGARWDAEVRALWVGTGKADRAAGLVRDVLARAATVDEIKASGLWVSIPYDAL